MVRHRWTDRSLELLFKAAPLLVLAELERRDVQHLCGFLFGPWPWKVGELSNSKQVLCPCLCVVC